MNKNAELNATTAGTAGQPKQPATGTKKKHTYPSAADLARGDRIKKLRGEMTIEKFAEKLNVQPSTISRWENGSTVPRGSNLNALHNMFNGSGKNSNMDILCGESKSNSDLVDLSGLSEKDKTLVRDLIERLRC